MKISKSPFDSLGRKIPADPLSGLIDASHEKVMDIPVPVKYLSILIVLDLPWWLKRSLCSYLLPTERLGRRERLGPPGSRQNELRADIYVNREVGSAGFEPAIYAV